MIELFVPNRLPTIIFIYYDIKRQYMYGEHHRSTIVNKDKIIGFLMIILGIFMLAKVTGWISEEAVVAPEIVQWIVVVAFILLGMFLMMGEHERY